MKHRDVHLHLRLSSRERRRPSPRHVDAARGASRARAGDRRGNAVERADGLLLRGRPPRPAAPGRLSRRGGADRLQAAEEAGAEAVGGPVMAAIPLACAAIAVPGGAGLVGFFVRKERKEHGLQRWVEGPVEAGHPMPGGRGHRDDRRVDGGRDRADPRARASRSSGALCVVDRLAGGGEAIAEAAGAPFRRPGHDRRALPGAPRPLSSRQRSIGRPGRRGSAANGVSVRMARVGCAHRRLGEAIPRGKRQATIGDRRVGVDPRRRRSARDGWRREPPERRGRRGRRLAAQHRRDRVR